MLGAGLDPKTPVPVFDALAVGGNADALEPRAAVESIAAANTFEPNAVPGGPGVKAKGFAAANADWGAFCSGGGCEASMTLSPGYVVCSRMESAYTIHHPIKTPSLFKMKYAGRGPSEKSISSPGRGRETLSLLERSRAAPMGEVAELMSSVMGSAARRESFAMLVATNTPVIFSAGGSLANGFWDRVNTPTSSEAVEATIRTSCRLGGKLLNLCRN